VSARVWRLDRQRVLARLQEWAQRLSVDRNVLAVVLFGSLARGDATPASDADVLIVLADSQEPFHHRIPRYLPADLGIGVDVFPYTVSEVQSSLAEGWGVARPALSEGIVLFERQGALRELSPPKA